MPRQPIITESQEADGFRIEYRMQEFKAFTVLAETGNHTMVKKRWVHSSPGKRSFPGASLLPTSSTAKPSICAPLWGCKEPGTALTPSYSPLTNTQAYREREYACLF